jgi:hypothetical protein
LKIVGVRRRHQTGELKGLNLLDFTFRVEREFGIRLPNGWHRDFWSGVRRGEDLSLEKFHALLLQLCEEQGKVPPTDGMVILLREAELATGRSFVKTGPQTMLRRDVAPSD